MDRYYNIFPLGDAAATIDFGNAISREANKKVQRIRQWFADHPFKGLKDVIAAYSSLSVFYDPLSVKMNYALPGTVFDFVQAKLEEGWRHASEVPLTGQGDLVEIPVCYDGSLAPDLAFVASTNHLSKEEIIELHTAGLYYVYMIGFLPGFSYMAEVDPRLVIPRKSVPVQVAAGSVGIAGSQTGIYPLSCPGGWQILGRTPWLMFDPASVNPSRLKQGDCVRFYRISREEYEGRRELRAGSQ